MYHQVADERDSILLITDHCWCEKFDIRNFGQDESLCFSKIYLGNGEAAKANAGPDAGGGEEVIKSRGHV